MTIREKIENIVTLSSVNSFEDTVSLLEALVERERKENMYKLRTLFRDGSDFDFIVTKMIEEAEGLGEELKREESQ